MEGAREESPSLTSCPPHVPPCGAVARWGWSRFIEIPGTAGPGVRDCAELMSLLSMPAAALPAAIERLIYDICRPIRREIQFHSCREESRQINGTSVDRAAWGGNFRVMILLTSGCVCGAAVRLPRIGYAFPQEDQLPIDRCSIPQGCRAARGRVGGPPSREGSPRCR